MPLFQPPNAPDLKRRVLRAAVRMAPRPPAIVEVGTMRYAEETDDGRSTLALGALARERGGFVQSVDVDKAALATAAEAVRKAGLEPTVDLHHSDGASFLEAFRGPIDVLYLDGGDDPRQALAQLEAAWPKLAPGAVLVVDDCHAYGGNAQGKGTLAVPRAREYGFRMQVVPLGSYAMALGCRRDRLRQRAELARLGLRMAVTRARALGARPPAARPNR